MTPATPAASAPPRTAIGLRWSHGSAAFSPIAAMLTDAAFDVGGHEVRPFARAPWLDGAPLAPGTPGHLRVLGGDFVGLPFGSAAVPRDVSGEWRRWAGLPLDGPPHGSTAEEEWEVVVPRDGTGPGSTAAFALDLPAPSPVARVERSIAGVAGTPELRFEHVIHARAAVRVPLGLHPIFALPEQPGALEVDTAFASALAYPAVVEPGRSRIPPGAETTRLSEWGLDRLPGDAPREEVVLLTGVTTPVRLRDRTSGTGVELDWDHELLPNVLLWVSDRGIAAPPWSGRYRGLGVEPVAAAFDLPAAVSTAANPLSARGVRTALELDPARPLTVRHSVRAFRLDDEETNRP